MRFPDCVAARRPLPAAIAWPDAMSGHFFLADFSRRAAPREKSPLGGQEAHVVRAPWGHHFIPKRPRPFMPPMARIIFAMPPFFICFIIPCICSN
ncbi:hypothetical protein D3C85_437860 [compost metagenome]